MVSRRGFLGGITAGVAVNALPADAVAGSTYRSWPAYGVKERLCWTRLGELRSITLPTLTAPRAHVLALSLERTA